uniref:Uncharacterized protein n=1 Tax=uncultured marine virus TaxID=186617 RepID=A0A0F7L3D7_9VIRU|nr:hypothetical protein [uncultured marine virus]
MVRASWPPTYPSTASIAPGSSADASAHALVSWVRRSMRGPGRIFPGYFGPLGLDGAGVGGLGGACGVRSMERSPLRLGSSAVRLVTADSNANFWVHKRRKNRR